MSTKKIGDISRQEEKKQQWWCALGLPPEELRCDATLTNGQCFGWRNVSTCSSVTDAILLKCVGPKDDKQASSETRLCLADIKNEGEWLGVVDGRLIRLRQCPTETYCLEEFPQTWSPLQLVERMRAYFQADRVPSLCGLYKRWSKDANFATIALALPGVRLIRQDPVECLISFICSSNNNISRITAMLDKLRKKYGDFLTLCDDHDWHAFPTILQLSRATVAELRELGFGYRADYIVSTVKQLFLHNKEEEVASWLHSLRGQSEQKIRKQLQSLKGVGRKVADCVALFSLDQTAVVPVDTHMKQVASRDYGLPFTEKKTKSVSVKEHKMVNDLFRKTFGKHAGWAHSVLFTADLPAFAHRLTKKTCPPKLHDKKKKPRPRQESLIAADRNVKHRVA